MALFAVTDLPAASPRSFAVVTLKMKAPKVETNGYRSQQSPPFPVVALLMNPVVQPETNWLQEYTSQSSPALPDLNADGQPMLPPVYRFLSATVALAALHA